MSGIWIEPRSAERHSALYSDRAAQTRCTHIGNLWLLPKLSNFVRNETVRVRKSRNLVLVSSKPNGDSFERP
jgi:hypothetical protein